MTPGPAALTEALARLVGSEHVLIEPALRAGFEVDWTGRWRGEAAAVVRPGTTAELAEVVVAAGRLGAVIVPQGGNSGLVGGGVPRPAAHPALRGRPQVVVSTTRLRDRSAIDLDSGEVVVGAGVRLAELQSAAAAAGFEAGIDLAARDSATIGGLISTNAGGIHVVRHGRMAARVAGLEAVLADGSVVRWPERAEAGALIGGEGSLGIVAAARLRLVAPDRAVAAAFVGVADVAGGLDLVARLQDDPALRLRAAELMLAPGMALVERHLGLRPVLATAVPVAVLVEVAAVEPGSADPGSVLVDRLAAAPAVIDAAVALDPPDRARLWQVREGHSEAIALEAAALGAPVHKLDVAVPLPRVAEAIAAILTTVARVASDARTIVFGHLAEGDLHVNILGPGPAEAGVDAAVLDLVVELGGSVAAEHGVGVAKVPWLVRELGPAALARQLEHKRRLDPAGILNPGVRLPG